MKKKRAWNSSNPLFRYLQRKKGLKLKRKTKTINSKVVKMARRRSRKSYSGRKGGKNLLMNGVMPQGGSLIGKVIMGVGVNILQKKYAPQVIPFQGEALSFAVAGAPGAVGAFASNMLLTQQVGTSATQQGIKFY